MVGELDEDAIAPEEPGESVDFVSGIAFGVSPVSLTRNTAVPCTRVAEVAADLMKTSIGIALSRIRAIISRRPLAQVVSMVKAMMPISSGNQPPCGTLVRLEAR